MNKNKIFYGWWILLGCILITMTMVPPIMALSNKYLLQVTEELGISRSSFSLVNTILQGLGIFISPFVSRLLAKGNLRKILCVSILGYVAAYASYSLAQNVVHLYISAFLLGIFYLNATIIPVSMMVTNWFVKKRGFAMSLAMAGIGVGGTIFSPVVTYLLGAFGWRGTYRIMALIILVVAFPTALFLLRKKPEDMGLQPYGAGEASISQKGQPKKESGITLSVSQSKFQLFFWLMLLGMVCNGLINGGSLGQFPPAIEELHGPALQATIISMYSLIGIFGKLVLGWINDKFGVLASVIAGCTMFGISFIFMLMGSNAIMLYIMAVCFGIGDAIGTVTPPLVTAAVFGSEKYGEAYGIANSATQIGLSFGSLMVAAIFDTSGSYTPAWILLLALTVVTCLGWCGAYAFSRKFCRREAA